MPLFWLATFCIKEKLKLLEQENNMKIRRKYNVQEFCRTLFSYALQIFNPIML